MEYSRRYSWCNLVKRCGKRARELVQWAKALVAKPGILSLMPGTRVVEEGTDSYRLSPTCIHMPELAGVCE